MDRKGWIILALCGLGFAANWHLMKKADKDMQLRSERQKIEQATSIAPAAAETPAIEQSSAAQAEAPEQTVAPVVEEQTVEIKGFAGKEGEVRYVFTSRGGGLKYAEILGQNKVKREGLVRVNERSQYPVGALATTYKQIENANYELTSSDTTSVVFTGEVEPGLSATKRWTVVKDEKSGGTRLELNIKLTAAESKAYNLSNYSVYSGVAAPQFYKEQIDRTGWYYYQDGDFKHESQSKFTGGWFSDAQSVVQIPTEHLEYYGVDSQYFTTFIQPLEGAIGKNLWATGKQFVFPEGKRWMFELGLELPERVLNGGESQSFSYKLFVGPKERGIVKTLSSNSDRVMNYGWWLFRPVAKLMHKTLRGIEGWFPESAEWRWGLSIVLLTIFIRILIWPLHNKSTRTMKRMSKLQPLMKEIREKYKDNPQKMNHETMKLYKEYQINPMGGCLPMLVQIPIFFGVFRMLTSAVELRGHGFLWVDDLSLPDTIGHIPSLGWPINLLPILMAVTMIFQMRMNPQTGDKMQRRIFMFMPLMFFFFCYAYASALALYWTTQNIVSIFQTWLMKRLPEPELVKRGKGGKSSDSSKPRKKSFMERMAEKMEEIHEQREAAQGGATTKKPSMQERVQQQEALAAKKKRGNNYTAPKPKRK